MTTYRVMVGGIKTNRVRKRRVTGKTIRLQLRGLQLSGSEIMQTAHPIMTSELIRTGQLVQMLPSIVRTNKLTTWHTYSNFA